MSAWYGYLLADDELNKDGCQRAYQRNKVHSNSNGTNQVDDTMNPLYTSSVH